MVSHSVHLGTCRCYLVLHMDNIHVKFFWRQVEYYCNVNGKKHEQCVKPFMLKNLIRLIYFIRKCFYYLFEIIRTKLAALPDSPVKRFILHCRLINLFWRNVSILRIACDHDKNSKHFSRNQKQPRFVNAFMQTFSEIILTMKNVFFAIWVILCEIICNLTVTQIYQKIGTCLVLFHQIFKFCRNM